MLSGVEKYLITQGSFFFFFLFFFKVYGPWEQLDQSMNFKFRLYFSSAVTTVANFELCLFFLLGSGFEDFDIESNLLSSLGNFSISECTLWFSEFVVCI